MPKQNDESKFFLVIPPNFEELALEELKLKYSFLQPHQIEVSRGGIELTIPIGVGLWMNHYLKIPTRILMRLGSFQAKTFSEFYSKVIKLPWEKWIAHPTIKLSVSATKSRLFHTEKIKETFLDAYKKYQQKSAFNLKWEKENWNTPTVFIRGDNNLWSISFDTSGDPLYKRGFFTYKNVAPLRENLASGLLLYASKFSGSQEIFNPLCGSGTFIWEAMSFHQLNFNRDYAYSHSPWSHYAKSTKMPKEINALFTKAVGLDLDHKLIDLQNEFAQNNNLSIKFHHHDVFTYKKFHPFMIVNPPYGIRLKGFDLDKMRNHLLGLKPEYLGIVSLPLIHHESSDKFNFSNGGLKVSLNSYI